MDEARVSMKDFLEKTPPGKPQSIMQMVIEHAGTHLQLSYFIPLPTIQMYCSDANCEGLRFFTSEDDSIWLKDLEGVTNASVTYVCKHCDTTTKTFALAVTVNDRIATVAKIGELPPFGPHTPPRVISLIGPDRETFLKGRRSESQGLGIGAFAYYRKIVDTHKDRIFAN
jgi:hypothetical protein